ncbi:SDR family oxidoreductase [Saccharothrix algeriensis]|uniref:NAD(P)-dependent dehydrogenase (Short-subunit alcohol dehydrogenase family)/3-oxoacyl-(Acyl-carrier-protein) synthase n=2 Tax=Saccharothrix algeriensis TaxID=173560 RepID=A0ABS2SH64_9PSEU|nr:SDR family oxidoreductase [Saccharothrix algeriensis]MBM7815140.1 NAD(P)-dependent dehydrogenase (short-subunit alcohol dehydrogenase family)/3-oxoacyl-(acyl-carrier-protein) synthase [Saccharothrix algeriensis]
MTGEFAGRVVVVTGGARGVGRAITEAFARRGAQVVLNYFHATAEAPRVVAELTGRGASVWAVRASVAVAEQVDALFDEVERRCGAVDVLVNNAASGALLPLDRLHESHWQRAVDTNLRGGLRCARRAAALMARRGGGAIVNLSSVGSSLVIGDYAAVGTTKAAVEALTRYLAVEFAPAGIRVNTASGGLLDGAVAGLFPDAARLAERVRAATPLGRRLGREEELAELVVFLASPAASWITGQTVVADGGLSLGSAMLTAPDRADATPPLLPATPPPPDPPPAPTGPTPPAATPPAPPLPDPASPAPAPSTPTPPVATARTPLPPASPTPEPPPSAAVVRSDAMEVAVVGVGVVTPGANDPEELWRVLSEGRNVFRRPVLFDVESFHSTDPEAEDRTYSPESGFITGFRPHPRLAAELAEDPALSREATTLWLRHCLHTALDGVRGHARGRCFAAFGYTADGSQDLEGHLVLTGYLDRLADRLPADAAHLLRARYDRLGQPPHEFLPHRVGRNAVAGLLPADTEVVMVDTACSSSLYAVDLGVKALREGAADLAVCGGAFAYSARNLVLFSKLQGLSRSGVVRCFDRAADGVLFSDGAGVVVLKRLDRAHADGDRVLGVVEGIGLAGDGRGKAIYAPNAAGQALALRRAHERAGVAAPDLGWVIAHATGTRAGDSAELAALREVAGRGGPVPLSSNKAVVGHTGWAAGLVSVSQALSGLARDEAPAQPYLSDPIPAVVGSRFAPPTGRAARGIPAGGDGTRRVGVSSFGFGGTDAHLVLAEDRPGRRPAVGAARSAEDVVVVGWAADLPGGVDPAAWLRGGEPPAAGFGEHHPLPGPREVALPPATLRGMDRAQVMVLRAVAALTGPVRAALAALHDTTGVVVGHAGPTRRAVHHALRCYLGDLDRALAGHTAADAGLRASLDRLGAEVRALAPAATEDSFPGIMPNIIASRPAAAHDFRGLNATFDGGPDSGLVALRAAERYLGHGDLDVAVVAAVSGNTTAEYRRVLGSAGGGAEPAEGAFLLVLTRESTARDRSLPVLGRLRTRFGPPDPATAPHRRAPLAGSGRTYPGADPLVAVLAHLVGGRGATTVGSAAEPGVQVDVTAPAGVTRVARRLLPAAPRRVRAGLPAVPPGSLVLLSEPGLLDGATLPDGVRVVIAPASRPDRPATAEATAEGAAAEEAAIGEAAIEEAEALLPATGTPFEHVRVLARLDAADADPADLSALDRLRGLHDLALLAAKRWSGGAGSSYAVLMVDAVRAGAPHPATGPFTGLVKALAREAPDALAFAVVTDEPDPAAGLGLVALETARAHDLAVVVHASAGRGEYRLVEDTGPAAAAEPSPVEPSPTGHSTTGHSTDGSPADGSPADGQLPEGRSPRGRPGDRPPERGLPRGVVVVAGGTRGLVARVLTRLVEQAAPEAVYLLGRHAPQAADLPSRPDFLAEQHRRHPERAVARLSAEYDRRAAAASVARTVRDLAERCGGDRVRFLPCDLTDPEQTRAAIGRVLAAHGEVDLLVNAAGAHHGGRLATTPPATLRRVRDTKLLAYLNLRGAFGDRGPARWLNVGSLLAVLGWAGEADYCSANDVLSAAAHWRAATGGGHEATLASPLWDESGFAAAPVVRDLLRQRGALTGVSDREGVDLVLGELRRGLAEPEVTWVGAAERRLLAGGRAHAVEVGPGAGEGLVWRPQPELDGYLRGHRLHGVPTLPGAWFAELAVAAALRRGREGAPVALSDLVFHAPLTVDDRVCRLDVADDGEHAVRVRVLRDVVAPDGRVLRRDRLHAEAVVEFAGGRPAPEPPDPPDPGAPPDPPDPGAPPGAGFRYAAGPVALDQPFTGLVGVRVGDGRARARFRPALGGWAERLAALRLPVLLVDALLQGALLARHPGAAGGLLPVPVGVARVDLLSAHNDVELLDRHGDGIAVVADGDGAAALAPDGTPLLRLAGVRAVDVARGREVSRAG